jgi:hypothetical protein
MAAVNLSEVGQSHKATSYSEGAKSLCVSNFLVTTFTPKSTNGRFVHPNEADCAPERVMRSGPRRLWQA